jgi:hypothetical protein
VFTVRRARLVLARLLLPPGFGVGNRWHGEFQSEVWEPRKSGSLRLLRHWRDDPGLVARNLVTDSGINDNESVYFAGGTPKTLWYIGLVTTTAYTGFAGADTIASHAGWTEFTGYNEAARQQWTPSAPAGRVITGSATVAFTMTAGSSLKGAFLVSNSTKGGTTGQLWSGGEFGTVQTLSPSQVFRTNYTLTGTAA